MVSRPFCRVHRAPCPRLQLGHSPANASIVRRLMPLTRWFWPYILRFSRTHTSVAALILWFGGAGGRGGRHVLAGAPSGAITQAPDTSSARLMKLYLRAGAMRQGAGEDGEHRARGAVDRPLVQ